MALPRTLPAGLTRRRQINWPALWREIAGLPKLPTLVLTILVLAAIYGALPWGAPGLADPTDSELRMSLLPPFWIDGGMREHLLGTDQLGRDILSRIVHGAQVSLKVGFAAVGIAGAIGSVAAMLAGYFRGWTDIIISRLVDALLSMPFLLVALVLAAVLGQSERNLILILAIFFWASYARILRGEVLRIREADFIRLAEVAGASTPRILFKHIFPNIFNTLLVLATLQLGVTILAEAGLSFLGLGVPPPAPAWGSMLADGRQFLTTSWWIATFPGLAIVFTVLAVNLLGDWLRVRLDPKFRQL